MDFMIDDHDGHAFWIPLLYSWGSGESSHGLKIT